MKNGMNILLIWIMLLLQSCARDPLATMPSFNLLLPDSSILNTTDLPAGNPYLFIHFDASCKGCQEETDSLLIYMDELKDVKLYFLTIESLKSVRLFRDYYKMQRYPNITLGLDCEMAFSKHFHNATTPFMAIYDRNKELRGVFEGQAKMDKLLTTLNEIR